MLLVMRCVTLANLFMVHAVWIHHQAVLSSLYKTLIKIMQFTTAIPFSIKTECSNFI